jgi:hypothetical protein
LPTQGVRKKEGTTRRVLQGPHDSFALLAEVPVVAGGKCKMQRENLQLSIISLVCVSAPVSRICARTPYWLNAAEDTEYLAGQKGDTLDNTCGAPLLHGGPKAPGKSAAQQPLENGALGVPDSLTGYRRQSLTLS